MSKVLLTSPSILSSKSDGFDGVLYMNEFGNEGSWLNTQILCEKFGKALVIDNSDGLFNRYKLDYALSSPIEIISASHLKPWGFGQCGLIICDSEQEKYIRGVLMARSRNSLNIASNFVDDLTSASILDRLEVIPEWRNCYRSQNIKNSAWLKHEDIDVEPIFSNKLPSLQGFKPFFSNNIPNWDNAPKSFEVTKYYEPLTKVFKNHRLDNAKKIYDHVFCISNSPEMSLIERSIFSKEMRCFLGYPLRV